MDHREYRLFGSNFYIGNKRGRPPKCEEVAPPPPPKREHKGTFLQYVTAYYANKKMAANMVEAETGGNLQENVQYSLEVAEKNDNSSELENDNSSELENDNSSELENDNSSELENDNSSLKEMISQLKTLQESQKQRLKEKGHEILQLVTQLETLSEESARQEMADGHVNNVSDEEDDSENNCYQYELKGILSKWTNYIHGWQRRFIVLKDGTLSYYKSEQETGFGCRGAISLFKATIKAHEFDECRFDVSVNDCVWYLRADSPEDKQYWVDILEAFKAESGYGSESSLKRHGSALSLASNTVSTASNSSFKRGLVVKEKLAEMETYKDILCNQIKTLQGYFDQCAETTANKEKTQGEVEADHSKLAVDFKGEALTFRETTAAMLSNLQQCLDAVGKREEVWRRRLERETDRRKQLEQQLTGGKVAVHSPDQEEGPHSTLNEDEFYDAVETGLDKLEEEVALRERLKQPTIAARSLTAKPTLHKLWSEVMRVSQEQIHYAKMGVGEVEKGGWQLFAEEGEMKMYRREEEVNGLVVDPLKACHVVKGVTGHEMCHYFFSPQYRHEWEATVEQMTVVETIREDTLVFHQVHRRIWPTSQRDALFWSHMTRVPDPQDRDGSDIWVVVNNSLSDGGGYQLKSSSKYVRIHLTVCLLCQTIVTPPLDGGSVTRDNITCKITYCSVVNPGGWVPASALRAVYKREYPKFLKRFTAYVLKQTKDKPILF